MVEWLEDLPVIKKILRRVCAASDCDSVFEPKRSTRVFCSDACRQAAWLRRSVAKRQSKKNDAGVD